MNPFFRMHMLNDQKLSKMPRGPIVTKKTSCSYFHNDLKVVMAIGRYAKYELTMQYKTDK